MKYKDIPDYLKSSELYKSLADDESDISLPCKENTEIKLKEDLVFLIKTLDFWDSKYIPYELFKYVKENVNEFKEIIPEVKVEDRIILDSFNLVLILEEFLKVKSMSDWAAKKGYINCLIYAHENQCEWDKDICKHAAKNGHLDCLPSSSEVKELTIYFYFSKKKYIF